MAMSIFKKADKVTTSSFRKADKKGEESPREFYLNIGRTIRIPNEKGESEEVFVNIPLAVNLDYLVQSLEKESKKLSPNANEGFRRIQLAKIALASQMLQVMEKLNPSENVIIDEIDFEQYPQLKALDGLRLQVMRVGEKPEIDITSEDVNEIFGF